MQHRDLAIRREVEIQLAGISPLLPGQLEGGHRVFRCGARGTSVRHDLGGVNG